MNISRLFILRPVATTLFMFAILLSGSVAFRQLPVSALPQVDFPTIQIQTFYPGAAPEVTASAITAPLERQLGQLPGLVQMTSTSSFGSSLIVLQFSLELNIDIAEQEVQAAINAAQTYLPVNLPTPPLYSKTNPADSPILTLAVTSKTLPLSQVEDLADTRLVQKISQLSGVGFVSISGGQKPAIRIQANPVALTSYGINLEDVRVALQQTSVNSAKGSLDGLKQNFQISGNDQLLSAQDYQNVVIAYRNGAPVFLKDVATILDGVENTHLAAWMNETPAIIVNIRRQPGANMIEVVDRIKALLPKLKRSVPSSMDVSILSDRTTTIRASVRDVEFELILTIFLVVSVIFIFLRNLSATLIPSVAVPVSLVGTFGIMAAAGYSLNNLTLMALTISTGFVVDDAIVMIENIVRYIEEGDPPLEAALKGSEQIGFTIISLTISLIAVLIPLLLMGDIVGRLFREFAITLSSTILVSGVVSLTLTPMMCSRLLKSHRNTRPSRIYQFSERLWDQIIQFYASTLRWVLRHQKLTLSLATLTLVLSFMLYLIVPKGFFPTQDTGMIQGISEASQTISFFSMSQKQQELCRQILQDPAIESLSSYIGIDGTNPTSNRGRIQINLKPIEERKIKVTEVMQRIQSNLETLNGIKLYMQPVQDLTVENRVTRTQYQYTLSGPHLSELNYWSELFLEKLKKHPELRNVTTDQQNNGLALYVNINRQTAARVGVSTQMIDDTLYDAFGQRQISTLYTELNQYHVILEVLPHFQTSPFSLNQVYLRTNLSRANRSFPFLTGALVPPSILSPSNANLQLENQQTQSNPIPLSAIVDFTTKTTPLAIYRQGQFPVITLSFDLSPHASLGAATSAIKRVQEELQMPLSIQGLFQGAAASFEASSSHQSLLILAALVSVYIVLGVLYESYIHPLTILSTLPSAGVGACLALVTFGAELDIISMIGIILLIGIVKKNGIMMVDFALEAQRKNQKPAIEAIYEACLLRFRPIMMTTMCALFAGIPLAFGSGIGSELRRPLGISMIGGLLLSQILTLYTTPVIYLFFDHLGHHFSNNKKKKHET